MKLLAYIAAKLLDILVAFLCLVCDLEIVAINWLENLADRLEVYSWR